MVTKSIHPTRREIRRAEWRFALVIAVAFAMFGFLWVLVTDILLYAQPIDPTIIGRVETSKGWLFVILTTVLLLIVALRAAARLTDAHAAISAIIESIGDGVLLLGADRRIAHANPAAVRMLNCDPQSLVDMDAHEFSRRFRVSHVDGSIVPPEQYVSHRVFDEAGPLQYKATLYPPGRPDLTVSVTAAAIRDHVDDPAKLVVSVMHDITDSEHLEQLRDQFFAGAAHSLKTPVAIIKTNVQALAAAAPGFERQTSAIARQCNRIDRLVQNLLVLARVRTNSLQFHPREMELAPLAEQIAREMATASPTHDVRTDISAAPIIHADEERLAILIRNLIENAYRSAKTGSSLTVFVRQNDGNATVGVRYQPLPSDEEEPPYGKGDDDMGVNQSVSATIAEAHGGSLREADEGAERTMWLELPLARRGADTNAH